MIRMTCTACGKKLKISDDAAGKTGKCSCGAKLRVPQAQTTPPPTTPVTISNTRVSPPPIPDAHSDIDLSVINSNSSEHSASTKTIFSTRVLLFYIVSPAIICLLISGIVILGLSKSTSKENVAESSVQPLAPLDKPVVPEIKHSPISGGAWLVKKSGVSDIIRGLQVYILKPKMTKKHLAAPIMMIKGSSKFISESWRLDASKAIYSNAPESGLLEIADSADQITKKAEALDKLSDDELIEIEKVYSLIVAIERLRARSQEWVIPRSSDFVLSAISGVTLNHKLLSSLQVSGAIVDSASTGINGKYKTKDIPSGTYLVYATQFTDRYFIEWLISAKVEGTKDLNLDLSNDNAAIVVNFPP